MRRNQQQPNQNERWFADDPTLCTSAKILSGVCLLLAVKRLYDNDQSGALAEIFYSIAALLGSQTMERNHSDAVKEFCTVAAIGLFSIGRMIDSENFISLNYSAPELRK